MFYPWMEEPWYLEQKERWEALKQKGWIFKRPITQPEFYVGISMLRSFDVGWGFATFVPYTTPRDVHTALLEACEEHDRNFQLARQN